jgi:hypothetical protein
MLQFGASLTDNASSVNYDCNMFMIQATGVSKMATPITAEIFLPKFFFC